MKRLLAGPESAPGVTPAPCEIPSVLSASSVLQGVVAETSFTPTPSPKKWTAPAATTPAVSASVPASQNQMAPPPAPAPAPAPASQASSGEGGVQEAALDLGGGSLALRIVRLKGMANSGSTPEP